MDIKRIHAAVEAYAQSLPQRDAERLTFFEGLMELQNRHADQAAGIGGYELPDAAVAEMWYSTEKPLFLMAPITIDATAFQAALEDVACYLIDHAGLAPEVAESLRFFDWGQFVADADLKLAGSDPTAFIEAVCEQMQDEESGSKTPPETLALVLAYALRPQLESAAGAFMGSLDLKKANENYNRPIACPVCGAHASAAAVGPTPSGAKNGKMHYCAICGTTWEFERIRCASCGTQNQGKLHYFHVEGDEAHRLYQCEVCGDYMRTVFREDLRAPFVFEVEDVVMAKLDMVAHDARFDAGERRN